MKELPQVAKRFLRYVKIDTQSDENSKSCPSTRKQFDLAKVLVEEMQQIGLTDISLDENCYLMGTLPSNLENVKIPTIGFVSHLDTSPDMSGKDVNPQIIEDYDGDDIVLNKEQNLFLSPKNFPELRKQKGKTLITTDGTTLLGADDKAGIAEILTAMEYLLQHPEIKHGTIRIAFTPDEEIGRGADKFDVPKFGADFAYTIDGGDVGELQFETFNAAMATIEIKGRNVHPGYAKNKMINSMHIATEFNSLLPQPDRPEHTQQYEGFFHLISMKGEVENSELRYIIRDHLKDHFEQRKSLLQKTAAFINDKYASELVHVSMKDQYYNMREKIEPRWEIVEKARQAMLRADIKPVIKPVRGGTDGSKLSFKGLPTPNIFAGGLNFHGKYEFIPVESMEKAVKVIVNICSSEN
jgi:tripeptide aminopeptidase